MPKTDERPATTVCDGTRKGLRLSLRKAFAGVTSEPLPAAHVDLLLALRQRERERADRRTS